MKENTDRKSFTVESIFSELEEKHTDMIDTYYSFQNGLTLLKQLSCPSSRYPIAPDCEIPNSVIRGLWKEEKYEKEEEVYVPDFSLGFISSKELLVTKISSDDAVSEDGETVSSKETKKPTFQKRSKKSKLYSKHKRISVLSKNMPEDAKNSQFIQLCNQLFNEIWFPPDCELDFSAIIDQLIELLDTTDLAIHSKVCYYILEFNRIKKIIPAKVSIIAQKAVNQLTNENDVGILTNCIQLLAGLNVKTDITISMIKSFLTSQNSELRKAARDALRMLGIKQDSKYIPQKETSSLKEKLSEDSMSKAKMEVPKELTTSTPAKKEKQMSGIKKKISKGSRSQIKTRSSKASVKKHSSKKSDSETKDQAGKESGLETKGQARKESDIETKAQAKKELDLETQAQAKKESDLETKAQAEKESDLEIKEQREKEPDSEITDEVGKELYSETAEQDRKESVSKTEDQAEKESDSETKYQAKKEDGDQIAEESVSEAKEQAGEEKMAKEIISSFGEGSQDLQDVEDLQDASQLKSIEEVKGEIAEEDFVGKTPGLPTTEKDRNKLLLDTVPTFPTFNEFAQQPKDSKEILDDTLPESQPKKEIWASDFKFSSKKSLTLADDISDISPTKGIRIREPDSKITQDKGGGKQKDKKRSEVETVKDAKSLKKKHHSPKYRHSQDISPESQNAKMQTLRKQKQRHELEQHNRDKITKLNDLKRNPFFLNKDAVKSSIGRKIVKRPTHYFLGRDMGSGRQQTTSVDKVRSSLLPYSKGSKKMGNFIKDLNKIDRMPKKTTMSVKYTNSMLDPGESISESEFQAHIQAKRELMQAANIPVQTSAVTTIAAAVADAIFPAAAPSAFPPGATFFQATTGHPLVAPVTVIPPASAALLPEDAFTDTPSDAFSLGAAAFPPDAAALPPGATALPPGTTALPSGAAAFPSRAAAFPQSATTLPPGTAALPPRAAAFPAGAAAIPQSAAALPSKAAAFPQSTAAFPSSATAFPSSATAFPPGAAARDDAIFAEFQNIYPDQQMTSQEKEYYRIKSEVPSNIQASWISNAIFGDKMIPEDKLEKFTRIRRLSKKRTTRRKDGEKTDSSKLLQRYPWLNADDIKGTEQEHVDSRTKELKMLSKEKEIGISKRWSQKPSWLNVNKSFIAPNRNDSGMMVAEQRLLKIDDYKKRAERAKPITERTDVIKKWVHDLPWSNIQKAFSTTLDQRLAEATERNIQRAFSPTINQRLAEATERNIQRAFSPTINQRLAEATERNIQRAFSPTINQRLAEATERNIQRAFSSTINQRLAEATERNIQKAFSPTINQRLAEATERNIQKAFSTTIKQRLADATERNIQKGFFTTIDQRLADATERNIQRGFSTTIDPRLADATDRNIQKGFFTTIDQRLADTTERNIQRGFPTTIDQRLADATERNIQKGFFTTIDQRLADAADRNIQKGFFTTIDQRLADATERNIQKAFSTAIDQRLAEAAKRNIQKAFSTTNDQRLAEATTRNIQKVFSTAVDQRLAQSQEAHQEQMWTGAEFFKESDHFKRGRRSSKERHLKKSSTSHPPWKSFLPIDTDTSDSLLTDMKDTEQEQRWSEIAGSKAYQKSYGNIPSTNLFWNDKAFYQVDKLSPWMRYHLQYKPERIEEEEYVPSFELKNVSQTPPEWFPKYRRMMFSPDFYQQREKWLNDYRRPTSIIY